VGEPLDEGDGLAGLAGRHARGGLVEEEDLRLQGQRDTELELLLAAVREEARFLVGMVQEADRAEDGRCLVLVQAGDVLEQAPAAAAMRDVRRLHVLEDGEAREDVGALEGATHAEPAEIVRRDAGDVAVLEDHLARVGPEMAGDEVEERRLARAVRPDDRADRARRHREAHPAHRQEAVEALREATHVKHGPAPASAASRAPGSGRPRRGRPETRRGGGPGWCRARAASTRCRRRSAGSAR
jgi:hypothetical protein